MTNLTKAYETTQRFLDRLGALAQASAPNLMARTIQEVQRTENERPVNDLLRTAEEARDALSALLREADRRG